MNTFVKSIPRIRLRTLRMIRGRAAGDYNSKRSSDTGFEFDALRTYEQGDDVRRIDWNSSVRTGSLMMRSFREQHNRTIILMIDLSLSTYAGSGPELKCHVIHIVANSLGFAAQASRDALGICITYNDSIMHYVPPRTGNAHIMHCIATISKTVTALAEQQKHATIPVLQKNNILHALPRDAWVIVITDGLVKNYETWWKQLTLRHTLTIVRVRDRYEKTVPTFCTFRCYDPEDATKATRVVMSHALQHQSTTWYEQQVAYARRLGISLVDLIAGSPYESTLRLFFEQGAAR